MVSNGNGTAMGRIRRRRDHPVRKIVDCVRRLIEVCLCHNARRRISRSDGVSGIGVVPQGQIIISNGH